MEGLAFLGLVVGIWTTAARLSSNKEVLQANAATQQKIELLRYEQRKRTVTSTPIKHRVQYSTVSAKQRAMRQHEADVRAASKANYVKY